MSVTPIEVKAAQIKTRLAAFLFAQINPWFLSSPYRPKFWPAPGDDSM